MNTTTIIRYASILLVSLGILAVVNHPQAALPADQAAKNLYVSPSGNDANTCLSPASPCKTINAAIGKAAYGDTVRIAVGTYTGSGDSVVLVNKNVDLSGGWDSGFSAQEGRSLIHGELSRRGVIIAQNMNTEIERLEVAHAVGDSEGGGGGFLMWDAGTVTISDCLVWDTQAYDGIGSAYTDLTVVRTTVRDGVHTGISNYLGTLKVVESSVTGNLYGIMNVGNFEMDNSTVSRNKNAGVLLNCNGTENIHSSTIVNNQGVGLRSYGCDTATIEDTILAGNAGNPEPDCSGTVTSAGYNLIGNTAGCDFTPGTGDITGVDPKLGELISKPGHPGYHPLLSGSPAIDAGNPGGCPGSGGILAADQRGVARVGRCDMGAYEYTTAGEAEYLSVAGGSPQVAAPSAAFAKPLKAAVLDEAGTPVQGVTVTFTAPASGASGKFADTVLPTTTAQSNSGGIATASTFTANSVVGSYAVNATASGVSEPAVFQLANTSGYYVKPDGSDLNDCRSPASACKTIGAAVLLATHGDPIYVQKGEYPGSTTIDRNVHLSGGWNSAFTLQDGYSTADGQGEEIVFRIFASPQIEGFIIRNGYSEGWDRDAGGVYIEQNNTVTLTNVIVRDNLGNGIENGGALNLINSVVARNGGAGIDNLRDNLKVSNTSIVDNQGVGIENWTIAGKPVLKNSVMSGNQGADGQPGDCRGAIASKGYNLIGSTSGCNFLAKPGDQVNKDAKLGVFTNPGYYPPLPDSPLVDAGNPSGCTDHAGDPLDTDQRGAARFGTCDTGAYELQALEAGTDFTASSQTAQRRDRLTFTLALQNLGEADLNAVSVKNKLPTHLEFVAGTLEATSGSAWFEGGAVNWEGAIDIDQTVTISYDARVGAQAPFNTSLLNAAEIDDGSFKYTRQVAVEVLPYMTSMPLALLNNCGSFMDDFSNPKSGWFVGEDELEKAGYLNGEYQVVSKSDQYIFLFDAPTCDRKNYTLEMDARWPAETGYSYGLAFKIQGDFEAFYLFEINTDYREYALYRVDQFGWNTHISPVFSAAIKGGTASNHLKVTHNRTSISLAVNGVTLQTVSGDYLTGLGGVGLSVAAYEGQSIAEARFDNFKVVDLPATGAEVEAGAAAVPPGAAPAWLARRAVIGH